MAIYERSVHVDAPLDEVWDFHLQASGLETLTPEWLNLRVEQITGPRGEVDPDVLETGSTIVSSVRPFGVGPRQRWTSRVVERRRDDGRALLRDEIVDGPFPTWEHTHRFTGDGDGTLVHDRVEYELPGGPFGRLASPFACVGFEPVFRHRHRRTKELLE